MEKCEQNDVNILLTRNLFILKKILFLRYASEFCFILKQNSNLRTKKQILLCKRKKILL